MQGTEVGMFTSIAVLGTCWLLAAPDLDTQFLQVTPRLSGEWRRSPDATRAVVLIQGLMVHPLEKNSAVRASLRSWQKPDSLLVKRLAGAADVFAFAYA